MTTKQELDRHLAQIRVLRTDRRTVGTPASRARWLQRIREHQEAARMILLCHAPLVQCADGGFRLGRLSD